MKKLILLLTVLHSCSSMIYAQGYSLSGLNGNISIGSQAAFTNNKLNNGENGIMVIDALDSVFFDLSNAVINGTEIEFPVYLRSNDPIYSLDFSFKYDHSKLAFDTIVKLANYMDVLTYYNTVDSTVRLTSYSFSQTYENDSALVLVKFTMITGPLCSGDLNTVEALLNGDACSYKVHECQSSGIYEVSEALNFRCYPNPASEFMVVESQESFFYDIYDQHGKLIMETLHSQRGKQTTINTSQLHAGLYFIKGYNDSRIATQKFVVK